ncbi:MAG: hypothetical protein OSB45_08855, partial [Pseudomonadales bacterium]|nr:hypothetical protein [Pseudomonadales bacterium]
MGSASERAGNQRASLFQKDAILGKQTWVARRPRFICRWVIADYQWPWAIAGQQRLIDHLVR